jgi:membrane fusion protein, adhesin transport system
MAQPSAPAQPAAHVPFPRSTHRLIRRSHSQLILTCGIGLALAILWAAFTSLNQVARGSGRIMPGETNKVVQHFEGGIVTEITVAEGSKVEAGDVLMRIDNSFSRAEFEQNQTELLARQAQMARLTAEANGDARFKPDAKAETIIPDIIAKERDLFDARISGLRAQLAVLDDQYEQKNYELSEMRSRLGAAEEERSLVAPKVESLKRLLKTGAVSRNELLDEQRNLQQLDAKREEMRFSIPRTESALRELESRREEIALKFKSDAEKERREVQLQIAKLEQSVGAMQDRSKRSDVVAPIAGTVNKLLVTTVGGVAKPGEPLVQIVPADQSIIIEARMSPSDRAEIYPGLPAVVKVSAYDFSTYGGLRAKVTDISPDALTDDKGETYFRVRLAANTTDIREGKPVVPGMLAQVDILKGEQTVLAALLRPVREIRDNALRQ